MNGIHDSLKLESAPSANQPIGTKKQNYSEAAKKRWQNPEFRERIRKIMKGEKDPRWNQTKTCKKCETTFKRPQGCGDRQWEKRKYCSPSCARKNFSLIRVRQWSNEDYRKMMIDAHKGKPSQHKGKPLHAMRGNKNPRWKGGITEKNHEVRTSLEYKMWRRAVFERDNYACVFCGLKNGNGKTVVLHADHIKPFSFYPELRFNENNGRTLCKTCHSMTPTYASRRIGL